MGRLMTCMKEKSLLNLSPLNRRPFDVHGCNVEKLEDARGCGTRTNFIGYWDSCVFLVYYICTCIYLATCPDLKNVEFFGAGCHGPPSEARLEFPGCERHTEGSLQDITHTSEGERVTVFCMIICNLYHLVTLSALSLKPPPPPPRKLQHQSGS